MLSNSSSSIGFAKAICSKRTHFGSSSNKRVEKWFDIDLSSSEFVPIRKEDVDLATPKLDLIADPEQNLPTPMVCSDSPTCVSKKFFRDGGISQNKEHLLPPPIIIQNQNQKESSETQSTIVQEEKTNMKFLDLGKAASDISKLDQMFSCEQESTEPLPSTSILSFLQQKKQEQQLQHEYIDYIPSTLPPLFPQLS